jgi:hypothetical protein
MFLLQIRAIGYLFFFLALINIPVLLVLLGGPNGDLSLTWTSEGLKQAFNKL